MRETKIPASVSKGRTPLSSLGRPTMTDVAALAGVSQMTVSRVINGGKASARTKEAVAKAIEVLGYRPNEAAQALAASKASRRPDARVEGIRRSAGYGFDLLWSPYRDFLSDMLRVRS